MRKRSNNLEPTANAAPRVAVTASSESSWLVANREAIEACNDFVSKHGLFSDGRRRF